MQSKLVALTTAVMLGAALQAHAAEWIVKESPSSVADTVAKLTAAVEGAGAKVFAVVDHAAGAKSVDMPIPDETLVIFGNPAIGTPIIAANPRAGIDLPIRVLIWDEGGTTKVGYADPAELVTEYGVDGAGEAIKMMTGALDKLTAKAVE